MSLFHIKNYAGEFYSAAYEIAITRPEEDITVAKVAEEIVQSTRDFISKRLIQELKGHPFEHFIAHVLNVLGYRTRISPEGADGGIDIIAHKDELGLESPIIKVQVKSNDSDITPDKVHIKQLYRLRMFTFLFRLKVNNKIIDCGTKSSGKAKKRSKMLINK